MNIKIKKAKNGSGYLYNGIYSRSGLKCFFCAFAHMVSEKAVFCTVRPESPKKCLSGLNLFKQGFGFKPLLKKELVNNEV